jgi:hypothetical protein
VSLSRSWLLLTVPVALAGLVLLSLTVSSLIRTVRRSIVASLPVRADQRVQFTEPGAYSLSFESSSPARIIAGLEFALTNADNGSEIPLSRTVFRTRVSSFTRTKLELYSFTVPAPGTYRLHLAGTRPSMDSDDAIVFSRRVQGMVVAHVLALVATGSLVIGAFVATGLAAMGR